MKNVFDKLQRFLVTAPDQMFKKYCGTLTLIERKEREKIHDLTTLAIIVVLLFLALHISLYPFPDNFYLLNTG